MKKALHIVRLGVVGLLLLGCASAAQTNEVIIEVNEQGYLPNEVTVFVGKDTRLTLSNVGTEEHDLGIVDQQDPRLACIPRHWCSPTQIRYSL